MKQAEVVFHFDSIAPKYDKYKKQNPYYYRALKDALKSLIPPGKKVLDFGCGTGEILAHLHPSIGIGYDISPEMVKIAKKKYKKDENLRFVTHLKTISGPFDYLIMIDVVEHLTNLKKSLESLKRLCNKNTVLVLSFVDSSWEPVLWLLEKLKLKMPEGPHQRLSSNQIIEVAKSVGFKLDGKEKIKLKPFPISPVSLFTFRLKRSS